MTTTALILHVQAVEGTGTAAGLLLLVASVPPILAPLAGTIADRVEQRKVMCASQLLQAVVIGIAAVTLPSLPVLSVLAFISAVGGTVFEPAAASAVPALVEDAHLPSTNARLGLVAETGTIIGPPLAGVLFPLVGARGVLALDATSFLVAALVLPGLPRLISATAPRERLVAATWEGLRHLAHDRAVFTLTLCFWLSVLTSAADDLVLPFLASEDLRAGPAAVGVLLAGASIGVVAGFAVMARRGTRLAPIPAILVGFGLAGVGNLATAVAPVVAVAFAAQVVRGAGIALFDPSFRTFVQRSVPRPLLGRAFANIYGGVNVCAATSYAIGGSLLDATSPRVMFVLIGCGSLAATALTALIVSGPAPRRSWKARSCTRRRRLPRRVRSPHRDRLPPKP